MKAVKTRHLHYERKLLAIQILLLIFASFNVFSGDIGNVSAVPLSPCIAVVPEKTINPTIAVGMNYTVSIYTNYTGSNVWGWELELSFDPDILHGGKNTTTTWTGNGVNRIFQVPSNRRPIASDPPERVYVNQVLMTRNVNYTIDYSSGRITFTTAPTSGAEVKAVYFGDGVVNGDLITTTKDTSARFTPGKFDNIAGKLSLTLAYFYYTYPTPPFVTSGPGILANVTFTVMGIGYSNITLGKATRLLAPPDFDVDPENPIPIIDANAPPGRTEPPYGSDHIGHGYFENIPNVHDVAVSNLATPTTAMFGDIVDINVTVRNEGNFTENFDVTVYANTTLVGTQTANLNRGTKTTLTFYWNTTESLGGNYAINATAMLPSDSDLSDNSKTAPITILYHDIAVTSVKASYIAVMAGLPVTVTVTVRNNGDFPEIFNVTTYYDDVFIATNTSCWETPLSPKDTKTLTFTWNTTGISLGTYTIKAIADIVSGDTNTLNNELIDGTVTVAPVNIIDYPVEVGGVTFHVIVESNSTVSTFEFIRADKIIGFNATGLYGTVGFCNVTIPKRFLDANATHPWLVLLDGINVTYTASIAENATHTFVHLTYNLSAYARKVEINGATVATPPVASFTHSPVDPILGEEMTFNASASYDPDGTIVSYAWDFGDGTKAIYIDANLTNTAKHTYAETGSHTLKLKVTDNDGLQDATQANVTVYRRDVAILSLTLDKTQVTIGKTVYINATVKNEGDFPQPETFSVTIYANTTVIETPITVTDLAPGALETLTFKWNTTNVSPGTYTIKAKATIVEGETETDNNEKMFDGTVVITKLSSNISISATPTTIKIGQNITISGAISPTRKHETVVIQRRPVGGSWSELKTVTTNDTSQYSYAWTPEAAGTYEVKAMWEGDDSTLGAESDKRILYVKAPPIASFTYTPSVPTVGDDVTFTSNSTDPDSVTLTWVWDFNGDGVIDAITEIATWTYDAAGTYTVKLTVTDNDGLTNTITRSITVNETPAAQPPSILPYIGLAAAIILIIAGIVIYLLKTRKTS